MCEDALHALTKRFFMENTQCPANSGRRGGGVHSIIHIVAMTTAAMPIRIQFDLNILAESPLIAKTKAKKIPRNMYLRHSNLSFHFF